MKRIVAGLLAGIIMSGVAAAADAPGAAKPAMNVDLDKRLAEIDKDPKALETSVKLGKRVATFCANCHGESGTSARPDVPNLAGQNSAYLLVQVRKFSDGRRRNEFMQGVMKAMSDEEKLGVVAFYSSQQVAPHGTAPNPALLARGKDLFFKICQRCHGDQGRGNEKIARIAGQQPEYLRLSLTRYRDGTGERIDPFMAANTRNLTDQDILSVVEYVSRMR